MWALILVWSLLFRPPPQPIDPPWYAASRLPARGEVTYYAPGLMRWVYELRIRLGQVPVCDPPRCVGYVATLRPGDLGRLVWLQPPGRPPEGPFLVVDYAAKKDFARLQQRGLVAEVDYETAQRWGMRLPLHDVLVLGESPLRQHTHLPLVSVGESNGARPAASIFSPAKRLWLPLLLHRSP